MLRYRLCAALVSACVLVGMGCHTRKAPVPVTVAVQKDKPTGGPALFRDVAAAAGITFQETNGTAGKFLFVETTPGGCAFLDYDNDGFQDLFLVQSGPTPGATGQPRPPCALYHNNGDSTFTDVTHAAGLDFDQGYAQGVTVGDYDNDGFPDLFLAGYDGCFLLHNDGHGHFQDVTAKAGVGERGQHRWATSAAFGDFDKDGYLDLIVLHYAPWTPDQDIACRDSKGRKDYCSPEVYQTDHPTLYRNNHNGTFTDVTRRMGLDKMQGRGLGVIWIDYDHDGYDDLYIANDLKPNMLLHNDAGRRFEEVGTKVGVDYGTDGKTLSGMGIAPGDYDNTGWESLAVTNFSGQPDSLYHATGHGQYEDATYPSGLGEATLNTLAFGIAFFDYDRDGLRDLIIGNGHIDPSIAEMAPNVTYEEPKQLFRNQGNGTFVSVTNSIGDLATPRVTRGLAVGDFDNDGRLDILANNHNAPAQLLHNESQDTNHWFGLRLEGVKTNRDGAGSLVWVTAGDKHYFAECRLGSSYASSSDKRLFFGLGTAATVRSLEVRWLDGTRQKLEGPLPADRYYWLREGGRPQPDPQVHTAQRR